MQPVLPAALYLSPANLSVLVQLSSLLPGVAVGFAAVAMARSQRRPQTAVVIGTFALAGLVLGTVTGFLFMSTPEGAGHFAGAAMLAAIIAASVWELVRKPRAEQIDNERIDDERIDDDG
jgi:putative Mn2+ efflux pump MntP